MQSPLKILHVEDASHWGGWVARILEEHPRAQHVGLAETGTAALEMAAVLQPDLVLLDIVLPDMDGFAIAEQLAAMPMPPKIVLLSARMDQATLYRAARPPFSGLLWKEAGLDKTLFRAIDELVQGHDYYPPEVQAAQLTLRHDPSFVFNLLSNADLDLLPRFGLGLTDEEIAPHLKLSVSDVRSQRRELMDKLGLRRSAELVHWAIRHGFVVRR